MPSFKTLSKMSQAGREAHTMQMARYSQRRLAENIKKVSQNESRIIKEAQGKKLDKHV